MQVEEFVGQRIRDRREELGMSGTEFGRRVGELLGKPWSRQTVSVAEHGKRSLGVTEVVVIANVLETRPDRLLRPPLNIAELELPSGKKLQVQPPGPDIGIGGECLREMLDEVTRIRTCIDQSHKSVKVVKDMLATLIAVTGGQAT